MVFIIVGGSLRVFVCLNFLIVIGYLSLCVCEEGLVWGGFR